MKTEALWGQVMKIEVPSIEDMLQYGSIYLGNVCLKLHNPFWKDVLEAFACFSRAFSPVVPEILSEALWRSDYSKFHCSIINSWYLNGIRFLGDLFNEKTGTLHSKETIEKTYNIKMTFLCYSSLVRSLPDCVKSAKITKQIGPIMPLRISLVTNHPNFSRFAYDTIVEYRLREIKQTNTQQKQKWIRDIGIFEDNSFVQVLKITKSTRIRMFQYKLVNRILATNKYLKTIKVRDDDLCTFCGLEPETLPHLFWNCPYVKWFISSIKTKILYREPIYTDFDAKAWFFPTYLSERETYIITLAKMVIHEARNTDTLPNIRHLINKLRLIIEIESTVARLNNDQDSFEKKWGSMKDFHTRGV